MCGWKERLKKKENTNIFAKIILKLGHWVKNIFRLITDKEFRAMFNMRTFHASRTQQTTQLTEMDRYPNEFAAAKAFFDGQNKKDIKILSFGCCTGEEVVTLRKYFPEATIVGAEINKESLRTCRKRGLDEKIHFVKSTPSNIAKFGPYDMVLAMAVLERTPHVIMDKGITDISDIYPYEKYEKQIEELDSYVKDGGLFVSAYAHYYLPDTPVGCKYEVYGNCTFVGQVFDTKCKLKWDRIKINDMFIKKMNVKE